MGGEELDRCLRGGFYFWRLTEEGDAQVVVDLEGEVGVGAFGVVGDWGGGCGEGEGGDCQLHQGDAPANESSRVVSSSLSLLGHSLGLVVVVVLLTRLDRQMSLLYLLLRRRC